MGQRGVKSDSLTAEAIKGACNQSIRAPSSPGVQWFIQNPPWPPSYKQARVRSSGSCVFPSSQWALVPIATANLTFWRHGAPNPPAGKTLTWCFQPDHRGPSTDSWLV